MITVPGMHKQLHSAQWATHVVRVHVADARGGSRPLRQRFYLTLMRAMESPGWPLRRPHKHAALSWIPKQQMDGSFLPPEPPPAIAAAAAAPAAAACTTTSTVSKANHFCNDGARHLEQTAPRPQTPAANHKC